MARGTNGSCGGNNNNNIVIDGNRPKKTKATTNIRKQKKHTKKKVTHTCTHIYKERVEGKQCALHMVLAHTHPYSIEQKLGYEKKKKDYTSTKLTEGNMCASYNYRPPKSRPRPNSQLVLVNPGIVILHKHTHTYIYICIYSFAYYHLQDGRK
ncbi:hypothetical protein, unlikely [Trypanosoma brucei gambiense DAL972]|uniref:Uncharacterized protein n=1 Tax=Trypanosoma brucei gambiense (strain MHOM/CI/86/DAL972) TaxID=679716 RepID=D0A2P3_TRYB9|nr:hypothetical protein, unlikely [Trypanosoma brucei gambiense DAL972]CBH15537.1 hypothetical protein, unlikely [Trypanosoma brucei gambiense DAL972]|eukprot:XP_011777801.1 hypothetical protein, unlikely [Trypanosoma brucei gambiense DAL972]